MNEQLQSQYLDDRIDATRLLRDNASGSCAAFAHNSFLVLYSQRSTFAKVEEVAALAQSRRNDLRLLLGLEWPASRTFAADDRWTNEGGSVTTSRLAPSSSYA